MSIQDLPIKERNQALFSHIINGIKSGEIIPKVCAKSVAVDAHTVVPEEVGTKHIVYSHGKVEKEIVLTQDMVLLTTLNAQGNPIIDKNGNTNTYDMKLAKFLKTYPKQVKGGHFVKDPYAQGAVMVSVALPKEMVKDGITLLPPGWGGYEGTLIPDGIIMLPFDSNLTLEEQINEWEKQGADKLDWYPNNEADTYSPCDKNGTFKDINLRKLFEQNKQFEGNPYKQKSLECSAEQNI